MPQDKSIVVVGGYGAVGRYIVKDLHTNLPAAQIIVAGRSFEKATECANSFPSRVSAAQIDLTSRTSIDAVFPKASLVILNTEAGAETVARACIDHGVSLISVAASVSVLRAFASMSADAKAANVVFVTEVGLAPGLTNLMLRQIVKDVPQAEVAELIIQLGMVGEHGAEAMDWTMQRSKEARRAKRLSPPLPAVGRYVIEVDFMDRDKVRQELAVQRLESSLALVPKWSTRLLPPIAPLLIKIPGLMKATQPVLETVFRVLGLPKDTLGLYVRARSDQQSKTMQLIGQNQSRVTGVVAAKVAAKLQANPTSVETGVIGMADVLTLDELRPDLEAIGCKLT